MNSIIDTVLAPIVEFVISTISTLGYPGITFLMGIESAAIPLPSEVIMPFSGFLVSEGRFALGGIALAGAVGSVIGSWITYGIGYYGGRPLIRRYGRFVFITEHDLALVDKFFLKFGNWATLIGRMLPIVRTYISIPAGISRIKFWPFTVAAFVGSYIWSFFLGWVGFKLGENWDSVRHYFRQIDWIIVLILLVGFVWWVRRHIKNRIKT